MLPCRDHPRVCGEHSMLNAAANASTGSSPRMRGTPCKRPDRRHGEGIIPAYAGNTVSKHARDIPTGDHPRVCGEHRLHVRTACQSHGIIPAYAGNTLGSSVTVSGMRDHPRVCGEHSISTPNVNRSPGSSPRMRGTRATFNRVFR